MPPSGGARPPNRSDRMTGRLVLAGAVMQFSSSLASVLSRIKSRPDLASSALYFLPPKVWLNQTHNHKVELYFKICLKQTHNVDFFWQSLLQADIRYTFHPK